jgi:osmotically-inducible protein OsmY
MSINKIIVDDVRAALARDPRIERPRRVAVGEQAGHVTLRGTVATPRQRRAAAAVATSVPGVRAVHDGLHVDPRDQWEDDELRGAALQALMSDDAVPSELIDAAVRSRWLTLKGEVRHQSESDAAFGAVSRLTGVGGITNEIKVITAGLIG